MAIRDDGRLSDGAWLLRDGDGLYLDETRVKDPEGLPALGAGKVLKHLFSQSEADELQAHLSSEHPEVDFGIITSSPEHKLFDVETMRAWINQHPSPDGEGLQAWSHQMMAKAILCGLTLVWRGGITTTLKGLSDVAQLCRSGSKHISRLGWLLESLILVTTISESAEAESEHMSLGLLTGEWSQESVEMPLAGSAPAAQEPPKSPADALKLIKSLLDQGLISKEEYEAKRAEIISRI